jgi:hypothetical protein
MAAAYAYATSFSFFAPYDDEGYMMLSVRNFLSGGVLYSDICTAYGPAYYFYEKLLHLCLALPVTHDVTRAICIVHWLVASSLLAWACGLMTRSVPAALFAFMQAVLHLRALVAEPGHPQEIVVLLLALGVLVAARGFERKWTLPALAAIGTVLVFTKINVGAFFGVALLLAWMCHTSFFRSHRSWFWPILVLISLLPFPLMKSLFAEEWVRVYAVQISAGILAGGAVAYRFGGMPEVDFPNLVRAGVATLIVSAIFIMVLLATGTSLSSMIEALVIAPAKLDTAFSLPLHVRYCSWSAVAALVAAIAFIRKEPGPAGLPIVVAKALYGVLGAFLLVKNDKAQLGYLLPWTWLMLVPVIRGDRPQEVSQQFSRAFVCLAAVWQGLQAYPVAGTQTAVATVLPILTYSLCLHDAMSALASQPFMVSSLHTLSLRTIVLLETLLVTFFLYVFGTQWCNPFLAWWYYTSVPRLELSGAEHLRLPEYRVGIYQALAAYLETESDTFISIPGQNSLYFWTHKPPPTYFNISEVVMLSDFQQNCIVTALERARRPRIILYTAPRWYSTGNGPLRDLIELRCREIKRFGDFHILELTKPAKPFAAEETGG